MRRLISLLAVLPLAACASLGGPGQTPGGGEARLLRQMPLYDGRVVVRGPQGYCIDRNSRRRQAGGTLLFLASCESLSGQAGQRVDAALIVVSVAPKGADTSQPTARDIARAMAPKKPLALVDEDGLAMVHFKIGGAAVLPGGDPHYWRGGMALNGHLLSMAVYGPRGSRIAGPDGRTVLRALATEIRRASPESPRSAPDSPSSGQEPGTVRKKPRGFGALLGGLFPEPS